MSDVRIVVRPPLENEYDQWAGLFRVYRDFYRLVPDEAVVVRVWSWIQDPDHETRALVAVLDGNLVGLAHYRRFARPSTGTIGLYLDDLLTVPPHRGSGIGRALIAAVADRARAEGCSVIRWITAEDNTSAQRLYDQVGTRTTWLTYDLQLA